MKVNVNGTLEELRFLLSVKGLGVSEDLLEALSRHEPFKTLNELHTYLVNVCGKVHFSQKNGNQWQLLIKHIKVEDPPPQLDDILLEAADNRAAMLELAVQNLCPVVKMPTVTEIECEIVVEKANEHYNFGIDSKTDFDGDGVDLFTYPQFVKQVALRELMYGADHSGKTTDEARKPDMKLPLIHIIAANDAHTIHQAVINMGSPYKKTSSTIFRFIAPQMAHLIGRLSRLNSMMCLYNEETQELLLKKRLRMTQQEFRLRRNRYHQYALDVVKNPAAEDIKVVLKFCQSVENAFKKSNHGIPLLDVNPFSWKKQYQTAFSTGIFNPKDTFLEKIGDRGGWVTKLIMNGLRTVTKETLEEEVLKWANDGCIGPEPVVNDFAVFVTWQMPEPRSSDDYITLISKPPTKNLLTFAKKLNEECDLRLKIASSSSKISATEYDADDFVERNWDEAVSHKAWDHAVLNVRLYRTQEVIKYVENRSCSYMDAIEAAYYNVMSNKYSGRKSLPFILDKIQMLHLLRQAIYHKGLDIWCNPNAQKFLSNSHESGRYELVGVKPLWTPEDGSYYHPRFLDIFESFGGTALLRLTPKHIFFKGRYPSVVAVSSGECSEKSNSINEYYKRNDLDNIYGLLGFMVNTKRYNGVYLCELEHIPGKTKGGTFFINVLQKVE